MPTSSQEQKTGYIGRIPVRNLWLLILYASQLFRTLDHNSYAGIDDNPDELPDLIAKLLCYHVNKRLRLNLSYGYQSRDAALSRVRGRIDHLKTLSHGLMQQGKIACSFSELTLNTPRNRYVRAALSSISYVVQDPLLAKQCIMLASKMQQIGVIGGYPNRGEGNINRFGRHDIQDRPMVDTAHLAFQLALPTEDIGQNYIASPDREIKWVRKLFEKGVAGFYNFTLKKKGWKVKPGKTLKWQAELSSKRIGDILPKMVTDMILTHRASNRRIVIDTKFNSVITYNKQGKERLYSGYLYQMYAYLRSQEKSFSHLNNDAMGVLLHPAIGEMVFEYTTIQNHELRFTTVDLTASVKDIKEQLLDIIK